MSEPPVDSARIDTTSGNAKQPRNRWSNWLVTFSLGLAAVLVYFTLRGLDWLAFWNALKNGHYAIVLLVIPIASGNYFIRAVRWRIFVQAEKNIPVLPVFWANMVGYMGNAYLPARAGELLRSGFLGKKTGLGMSYVLATALAERLMDVIALVVIGSVSLLFQTGISGQLAAAVRIMALAGVIGLAVFLAAPFQEKRFLRFFQLIPSANAISQFVSAQMTRFLTGMRSLQNLRRLSLFTLMTAVIWCVDAFGTTLGVRIVSQTLTMSQALILLAALGLSSAIPSTPGYIGVYQFVAVIVLAPFGFSHAVALAYILINQVLGYLLVSFWGLIGLWQINKKTRSVTVST